MFAYSTLFLVILLHIDVLPVLVRQVRSKVFLIIKPLLHTSPDQNGRPRIPPFVDVLLCPFDAQVVALPLRHDERFMRIHHFHKVQQVAGKLLLKRNG